MPCHAGPHREAPGRSGGQERGEHGRSLHCGLHRKASVRQDWQVTASLNRIVGITSLGSELQGWSPAKGSIGLAQETKWVAEDMGTQSAGLCMKGIRGGDLCYL